MTQGTLYLAGGGEFGGAMATPDRRLIELSGGKAASIAIIPAAAAPDNNHHRAGQNGVRWFQSLGAQQVTSLPLVDRDSADDPALAAALRQARLIYLLGGYPGHLRRSLAGSLCWQAVLDANQSGAAIAGSSAGAMVLCQHYFDPYENQLAAGLNLIPNTCVLPHHNQFGQSWASRLLGSLPGIILIGIDEQTSMIDDGGEGRWRVYGKGLITIYRNNQIASYPASDTFILYPNSNPGR